MDLLFVYERLGMEDNDHDHEDCHPPSEELIKESDQKISDAIRQALDERFPAHAPHLVINWQLSATVMSNDGERYIWPVDPFDSRLWDTMGMIDYCHAALQARIIKGELERY